MKKVVGLALLIAMLYSCGATKGGSKTGQKNVSVLIDLVNVTDDKVMVKVDPMPITKNEINFYIPKTVPGTYSNDDYGKYIENLKAFDVKGNELVVTKTDDNTWHVSNAIALDYVTYWVNDTFDTESTMEEPVFSPAGTNILKGENFMLNLHGFVGYFDALKEVPYTLTINKPENLVSTTSLEKKVSDNLTTEVFEAGRYFEVIDNPILYAAENSISFEINGITINLSVYSPSGSFKASSLKESMEKMMAAQKTFLGDVNSTKEYNILLYLSNGSETDAMGGGALEHHTSTVVVLPENRPKEYLEQTMVDVVSHEFFHIVTPLNVHSKEVQYFNFNNPQMSQHLWMYEGTTEYFANLFQIQQGLISEADFYERLNDKVVNSKRYNDAMSFTKMSKNILVEPYKANYINVYEKGALINMCLDITLRELSNGEKGVLWLMKELSKKYDVNTPFVDDNLISEITTMTYPEVGDFFAKHVVGNTPIDYKLYFDKVGLQVQNVKKQVSYLVYGQIPFIDANPANEIPVFIREGIALSSFYTSLGLQGGDLIKSINGDEITMESIREVFGSSMTWNAETDMKVIVDRNGEELTFEGKAGVPELIQEELKEIDNPSKEQQDLRKAWMYN